MSKARSFKKGMQLQVYRIIDVLKIQVHDSIFVLDQIRTNRLRSHSDSDSVILVLPPVRSSPALPAHSYHMFVLDS